MSYEASGFIGPKYTDLIPEILDIHFTFTHFSLGAALEVFCRFCYHFIFTGINVMLWCHNNTMWAGTPNVPNRLKYVLRKGKKK